MRIIPQNIKKLLQDDNAKTRHALTEESKAVTRQYFGRTISIYAPLYLGNYCENNCVYCGFSSHHKIKRTRLKPQEICSEMKLLAGEGIQNILLLTGQSDRMTPVSYIADAVSLAREYFPNISIEVQPLKTDEYKKLASSGVDGVTVYQETYDKERYDSVHVSGQKKDYQYRYETPERAAEAGIRAISMGILLGIADPFSDICALYEHLSWMEKNYPGVEYSISVPRIVPVAGMDFFPVHVSDELLLNIICLTRILFPRIGINLSTRENPDFRDRALEIGVTRMSAGSSTVVGGYTHVRDGGPQFGVHDGRSVGDVVKMLKCKNYDPVFTEWRRIANEEPALY